MMPDETYDYGEQVGRKTVCSLILMKLFELLRADDAILRKWCLRFNNSICSSRSFESLNYFVSFYFHDCTRKKYLALNSNCNLKFYQKIILFQDLYFTNVSG